MTVLVTDDFDRTAGDTVGNDSNGNAWQEASGDWDLASGGVIQTDANATPGLLRCGTDMASANHWLEVEVAQSDGSGQIGFGLRVDASTFTCLNVEVADGQYKEIQVTNGSPNTGATGASHTHATGEVYAAEVSGNTITLYLNGSNVFQFTSSFNAGDTRVGLHINESSSGAIRFDNFRAGDGAYPGLGPPPPISRLAGADNSTLTWEQLAPAEDVLVLLAIANDGGDNQTTPTDFTRLDTNNGTSVEAGLYYRICTGSESGTIIANEGSFGVTGEEYCWHAIRIAPEEWHGTTPPEAVKAGGAGTTGTIDPGTVTPSWGSEDDNLWLVFAARDDDDGISSLGAVYATNFGYTESAASTGSCEVASSWRTNTAASENPGTATQTSTDEEWIAYSVAVRPAGTGAVTGSLAETQGDQTSAASGTLGLSGTLTETQDDQSGSGAGTLAETQDDQTSTAAGTLGFSGQLAVEQDDQTSVAEGSTGNDGSLAVQQDDETSAAAGTLGLSGSLAVTDTDDELTATGAVGSVSSGTLAETQDDQTVVASGLLGFAGTLAVEQDDQTSTAAGLAGATGTLTETQGDQTSAATGVVDIVLYVPPPVEVLYADVSRSAEYAESLRTTTVVDQAREASVVDSARAASAVGHGVADVEDAATVAVVVSASNTVSHEED